MSYFPKGDALNKIKRFLHDHGAIARNLIDMENKGKLRPSHVLECYSFIKIAEAFEKNLFGIMLKDAKRNNKLKVSVKGTPDDYIHFTVDKHGLSYEMRQNQACRTRDPHHDILFNLDIVIGKGGVSPDSYGRINARDLLTFCECKHKRKFYPSDCAGFIGLARMVMPNTMYRPRWPMVVHPFPPPALLVSGSASPGVDDVKDFTSQRKYHIRYFDRISPRRMGTSVLPRWLDGKS